MLLAYLEITAAILNYILKPSLDQRYVINKLLKRKETNSVNDIQSITFFGAIKHVFISFSSTVKSRGSFQTRPVVKTWPLRNCFFSLVAII